jgi:RHS repeat-associated protein
MRMISGRSRRRAVRVLAVAAAVGLVAQGAAVAMGSPVPPAGGARLSLAPPPAGSAAAAALRVRHGLGAPRGYAGLPGHHAARVARPAAIRPWQLARPAPAPVFPAPGSAVVTLPPLAGPAAGARGWARAGGLPVQVAAASPAAGSAPAGTAVSRVTVTVASHAAARAAGADGMLFALQRAGAAARPARVRVRVSYARFASAYGGGFGPRLALFAVPACALTTPKARACQAATPVAAVNDWKARTLSATVSVAPAGAAPLVLAATSTTSGGSGDFKATSLTSSSQWQVGLQSGDFSYSYPLRVPPPVAGAAPSLALSYDSQASDGETAQANSQSGQLGEGFSLAGGGFIERKYASCADHVGDSGNNTGQTAKTGDLCWDGDNAVLSLAGHSGQIVLDTGGTWQLGADDGSTVKLLFGGTSNGAYNNSHWEIITPDGTQYWFGLNQLPGYVGGDQVTNSVWTVPVVGLKSGDRGNTPGSYANSVVNNMAWRWNLDLVVDPDGNATSYYYTPKTSYYAFDSTASGLGSTWLQYDSGGRLSEIYYGSQDNTANGSNVYAHRPFHVTFGYSDRCTLLDSRGNIDNSTCDANHSSQTDWPDTPWDLFCGSSSGCTGSQHDAPAFFDTQMLTSVTTSLFEGSNPYQNVDTWTLKYDWLAADVNSDLVLDSVSHVGDVGGTTTPLQATFGWTSLDNRVPYDSVKGGGTYPAMGRYRMTSVISETGAQTSITYNPASCASSAPDPATNTLPCFQQVWAPGDLGGTPTTTSWFYKYTVSQVEVDDVTGGQPPLVTSYIYCGASSPQCTSNSTGAGGAWHYDTDIDLVPAKDKSYGQWRGYRYVQVITGDSPGTRSETGYTFLRGMDGNPVKSSGSWTYPPVAFKDSRNEQVTDSNQWNGFQLEKITDNGPGGAQVSDQVGLPWASPNPTASTANQPWGRPLTAYLTGTAETDTYTPRSAHAGGGTRHTQVTNTFDSSTGLPLTVTDNGDLLVPSQALCTTYSYPSPASTAGLIDYPDEVRTTACGTSGTPTVSDTKNSYDGQAFGVAPTAGNVTETDVYSSGDPDVSAHWVKQYRGSYDSYGRMRASQDASGNTTTYGYTSGWGAGHATVQTTVTSPLTSTTSATTTTDLNPEWGAPKDTTDPNGQTTTYCHDPLGRVTAVWLPAQAGPSCAAANIAGAEYSFSYSLTATAPPYVATTKLVLGSIPVTSYQIYDSLLRLRQTQAPAEGPGGGTQVTDTFYDSRGNAVTHNGPYNANTTASGSLWHTTEPQVPNETAVTYDGAGRQVESDFDSGGSLLWTTTWSYPGGDAVTVTPPPGGTITTTYTDARGRTTETDQYHSMTSASGAYDATAYAYARIPGGSTKTVTDAGGNTWTWTSDLLGRQVSAADPDTGTSTSTYNDLGQLTSTTDAAPRTVSYTYDAAGRKTGEYAAAVSAQAAGNQLAAWTYDTPAKGQPASATAYVGGAGGAGGEAYQQVVNSYDTAYRPTSTTYTIPSNPLTGSLAGSYTVTASYNLDGTPDTLGYPAAGPLAAETVNFGYDNKGLPYSEWSSDGADASDYAEQSVYTPWGAPAEIDLGTSTSAQWSRMLYSYDGASLRLTQTRIQRQSNSWANDTSTRYTYDPAGNVTSATDPVTGDNQCYAYDYLARLTAAWAQPSATCPSTPSTPSTPPGASGLGGPAPYQQTLSYDNGGTANGSTNGTTGNITDSTLITGTGSGATTTDVSYQGHYPAYGTAHPHAPASYTTTTTNGNAAATTQAWTAPGQLASTTTGTTTPTTYNWNGTGAVPGQLASVTTGTTTTSYRYDASGNLLIVKDGPTARLYLPGQELSATGTTLTATRYYSLGGHLIAARTGPTAPTWLFSDPHGTATTAINPSTQALTWRWYTPFGQFRPPVQGTWPGTRRFVGGTYDSTTGLTNLGARQYKPATPAFISPDPILNPADPQNLNPYTYATNNPVTNSDPTGLCSQTWCPKNVNRNDNDKDNSNSNGNSNGNSNWNPLTSTSGTIASVLASKYRQFVHIYNVNLAMEVHYFYGAQDIKDPMDFLKWEALVRTCRDICSQAMIDYARKMSLTSNPDRHHKFVGANPPDFYNFNVQACVFVCGGVSATVDRYGRGYLSWSYGQGLDFSFGVAPGFIDNPKPKYHTPDAVYNFITGPGESKSLGVFYASVTHEHGNLSGNGTKDYATEPGGAISPAWWRMDFGFSDTRSYTYYAPWLIPVWKHIYGY